MLASFGFDAPGLPEEEMSVPPDPRPRPDLRATPAWARTVTDSAGRDVEVPDEVEAVFAAGPPASVLVYVMRPEALTGWPRALCPEEEPTSPRPTATCPRPDG